MPLTIAKKEKENLKPLLDELKEIKFYLKKIILIIPEESIKDYTNSSDIKNDYLEAISQYPPFKD